VSLDNDRTYNILVTGVGAIVGYGIINSLRSSHFTVRIIGMDIYYDAVGQYWCDKFIQSIPAADDDYLDFIKKVIDEEAIDLVFFGTEQEIYRINDARAALGSIMEKMVINKPELLVLSRDKWLTREYLLQHDLADLAIPSVIDGSYEEIADRLGVPFLIKPRSSYATKGIVTIFDKEEFDFYRPRVSGGFMAQELIGDNEHEYSVGVFGLGDGSYSSRIMFKRKLSQEGATAKAWSYEDSELIDCIDRLTAAFQPVGPTNYQFRYHDGHYMLLEVNPRISSSTSIRSKLGHNEAEMCLQYFLEHAVPTAFVEKGAAFRFIDEVMVYE
jgi:carbamoyl-phosphate synthase large subunit